MGAHSESIRTKLEKYSFVKIIDSYVSSSVEEAAFRSSDIVWCGYTKHYAMSGVLIQALAYSRIVLSTRDGLMGWFTEKYGLGITVDAGNVERTLKALEEMIISKTFNATNEHLCLKKAHSWEHFDAVSAFDLPVQ